MRSFRPKFKALSQTIRIMPPMAYERIKPEHAGAKNGGGA